MAWLQNGPIPTRLTLLSDLRKFAPGSKVRFLGCVTKYSLGSAILTLEHNHPQGNRLKALVDVDLLLNAMKSNETRIGEWVNVIGYIQSQQKPDTSEKNQSNIPVQAIVLWSSGPFNLEGYERSLDQKNTEEITNTLG